MTGKAEGAACGGQGECGDNMNCSGQADIKVCTCDPGFVSRPGGQCGTDLLTLVFTTSWRR